MRKYQKEVIDQKRNVKIVSTFLERIMFATPKNPIFTNMGNWDKDKKYCVVVNKMSDGRFCIYRELGNMNLAADRPEGQDYQYRSSGYKVFKTLEDIERTFDCVSATTCIDKSEFKIEKEQIRYDTK